MLSKQEMSGLLDALSKDELSVQDALGIMFPIVPDKPYCVYLGMPSGYCYFSGMPRGGEICTCAFSSRETRHRNPCNETGWPGKWESCPLGLKSFCQPSACEVSA